MALAPLAVRMSLSSPADRQLERPLVFAHRGGRDVGPENTIVAFDGGLADGADGLEIDVHLSADGRVVVCHDPTLDRTTDATGPIAARTARELAAVNAAVRFGVNLERAWTGPRAGVPTLADVLWRYPGIPLIVEMKAPVVELGDAVVAEIRAAGAAARACLGSFEQAPLDRVRAIAPEIATSASRDEARRGLRRTRFGLGLGAGRPYRALQVPERTETLHVVTPRFIRAAHRVNLAIQVWTVNDEADMRRLFEWGVDGLVTDRPAAAVSVRDEWMGVARSDGPKVRGAR